MSGIADPAALAREIIDESQYMTLATADADGVPWASPVWFATADRRELFWISKPEARHSRNLAARPELAIAIFDSNQVPGTGRGVYIAATAAPVPEAELDPGIEVYASVSLARGAGPFSRADVEGDARHRLYRASAAEYFVLSATDERIPVDL